MAVRSEGLAVAKEGIRVRRRRSEEEGVRLFVGLPLDAALDRSSAYHSRAIAAGLRALKLLGLEGVEMPVWWGLVEKEAMGKHDWSGYLTLAKMVQDAGLKIHVSLCFHASDSPKIPLPPWVSQIGQAQPDIFFADRSGERHTNCLSLAVDDLPLLNGKTPLRVYEEFLESFKSAFSSFLSSTITDISVGLGPDGELRYPSFPSKRTNQVSGVGEFQCYDKHSLDNLRLHAQVTGNPNWGLGGPHDAPTYYEMPNSNGFFKENGGSWQTPYGNFFLSWYSDQLISHGERVLSLASRVYDEYDIALCGKVPLAHEWYRMRSHPSEMTAGFYNADSRDGYDAVAQMFAKNSCAMTLPGMNLSDKNLPRDSLSSPELLLAQIKNACERHGVPVYGENSLSATGPIGGLDETKKHLSGDDAVLDSFLYQRMGEEFFSPEHFPSFVQMFRSINQPKLHFDNVPVLERERDEADVAVV
ncbi:hypothetical protein Syun_007799 [Stephania yunnanensis]|uniref:Beta-amylase n=1 Tax=Stephania yunnanensis TaxID=152371 RepID=A0AAP0KZ60_9MAGN